MKLGQNLLLPATTLAALTGFASAQNEHLPREGQLNVLMIVLDDIGADQLRMYGNDGPAFPCPQVQVNTTPTPGLELLRLTGIRYSRAYVNPLCSATRAAILTGRYGLRTGVGAAIDRGSTAYTLPNTELFIPELIRDQNSVTYARAAFGKWHLAEPAARDGHAAENGFERFEGAKGNIDDHYTWRKITATGGDASGAALSSAVTVSPGGAPPSETSYVSSVNRRDAATWINAQTKPFFAYVCFNPPHAPFQVPPLTRLSMKTRSKLAALGYDPGERAAATREEQSLVYQAQIEAVDREILDLLVAIANKLPHTMIIVVGDNGTPSETTIDVTLAGKVKRSVYELGERVPLLVSGPLTWNRAGDTCRNLVSGVDLYRLAANFTGISNPKIDTVMANLGRPNDSISPYYTVRNPNAQPRRSVAYSELFGNLPPPIPANVTWLRSNTNGTYRYVRRRLGGVNFEELYDLTADPCNLTDLRAPPNVLTPAQQTAFNSLSASMDAL
jgi:arylsulfatase B